MPRQPAIHSYLPYSLIPGWICLLLVFFLGIPSQQAGAQQSPSNSSPSQGDYTGGQIAIEPTGALWLEGSASIVDYRCYAQSLAGNGRIENRTQPTQNIQGNGDVEIRVTIPVKTLECGKKKMNRDMYNALKADKHPQISYRLLDAELLSESTHPDSVGWMKIQAKGMLTIAGVTDTTNLIVQGQLIGEDRFRVKGVKPLNMHDFEIEPPTALMGLIKANEELTVHFDVSVQLKDE